MGKEACPIRKGNLIAHMSVTRFGVIFNDVTIYNIPDEDTEYYIITKNE